MKHLNIPYISNCRVAELIEGKGAAKKGRYQGKANRLSKKQHAEKLILDHLGVNQQA